MLTLKSAWRWGACLAELELSACLVAKQTSEIFRSRNGNVDREVMLLSVFHFDTTFSKNTVPNFSSNTGKLDRKEL